MCEHKPCYHKPAGEKKARTRILLKGAHWDNGALGRTGYVIPGNNTWEQVCNIHITTEKAFFTNDPENNRIWLQRRVRQTRLLCLVFMLNGAGGLLWLCALTDEVGGGLHSGAGSEGRVTEGLRVCFPFYKHFSIKSCPKWPAVWQGSFPFLCEQVETPQRNYHHYHHYHHQESAERGHKQGDGRRGY